MRLYEDMHPTCDFVLRPQRPGLIGHPYKKLQRPIGHLQQKISVFSDILERIAYSYAVILQPHNLCH